MNRILTTLNRRLDACFTEMEIRWATYKADKGNAEALDRYTASLRRADRLWKRIKSLAS